MTSWNFKGWNVKTWLYNNKELFKLVLPALIAFAVTNNWIETGLATLITKLLADVVEYYIKE